MVTPITVESLGEFTDAVRELRNTWKLENDRELWFRGESRDYAETTLRPELYRPERDPNDRNKPLPLRSIADLMDIEYNLHEEFQRNAAEYQTWSDDDWDWDSYFLMQHHEGPTRLLDWSDGALMAMHFGLRNKANDNEPAYVYVLDPYRLLDRIDRLPEVMRAARNWKAYAKAHDDYDTETWDELYLPRNKWQRIKLPLPVPPCVLEFPHITRRIAAQRSRFIVFGTDPNWIQDEFRRDDSAIRLIKVKKEARSNMRQELRDCGITESVIFPDLDGVGRETKQLWEDRRKLLGGS